MADNEAPNEGESGKKSKKKLIILIALGVILLLGGGGGAAYFLLMTGDEAAPAETNAAPVRMEAVYTKIRTLEGKPSFVATLQSADTKRHYMQVFVEAKSRDPLVDEALKKHMPLIVSRLNALFSSQNFEELQTIEAKQALRADATAMVQSIMQDKIGQPGIETVLFTNLVMQ